MPQVPIIMPQLGESIAEATIVDIKVKPGDDVADDHDVVVHHGAIKTQTKQPSRQCSGRR